MIPVPPTWIAIGGLALALAASNGVQEFKKAGLRADLAEARLAVVEVAANRDRLAAEIARQNAAVERLQAEAETAAARADARVQAALRRATVRRNVPVGAGPAEVNRWLREYFPPPP